MVRDRQRNHLPYLIQIPSRCEGLRLWGARATSAVARSSHSIWTRGIAQRVELTVSQPTLVQCPSGLLIAPATAAADATVSAAVNIPMKVAVIVSQALSKCGSGTPSVCIPAYPLFRLRTVNPHVRNRSSSFPRRSQAPRRRRIPHRYLSGRRSRHACRSGRQSTYRHRNSGAKNRAISEGKQVLGLDVSVEYLFAWHSGRPTLCSPAIWPNLRW